jgi:copper chaperone NosL
LKEERMRMKHSWLIVLLISLLIAFPAPAALRAPLPPPAQAKCPVCGMFVGKYPDWTGSVMFKDGTTVYFDGPKDLFSYCLNMKKYSPARSRADIAALYVKDYYSLTAIDGRTSLYVVGSDVTGPMGKELIPFEKKSDADGFLKDHKGKRVLRFGEITPEIVKALE